jgi:hypothetical protein
MNEVFCRFCTAGYVCVLQIVLLPHVFQRALRSRWGAASDSPQAAKPKHRTAALGSTQERRALDKTAIEQKPLLLCCRYRYRRKRLPSSIVTLETGGE